jgi:hypothetical protein
LLPHVRAAKKGVVVSDKKFRQAMSEKALRQLAIEVRDACDRYLNASLDFMTIPVEVQINGRPGEIPAAKMRSKSVKGNPICKCGHNYSVHDEPRNVGKIPQNICRGCDADGSKIGCPEFVSKRGGVIAEPKSNGAREVTDGSLQPIHRAILAALAAKPEKTAQQVAIISVYVQSGTFNSAIADLRDLGFVEGSPLLKLTPEGKRVAVDIGRKYDAQSLCIAWSAKFGTLGSKILGMLYQCGEVASSADLAALCKYVQSGTFNSEIAKMRRMGLIAKKLPLRLCDELSS